MCGERDRLPFSSSLRHVKVPNVEKSAKQHVEPKRRVIIPLQRHDADVTSLDAARKLAGYEAGLIGVAGENLRTNRMNLVLHKISSLEHAAADLRDSVE